MPHNFCYITVQCYMLCFQLSCHGALGEWNEIIFDLKKDEKQMRKWNPLTLPLKDRWMDGRVEEGNTPLYHSLPCFLHLSVRHVQTAAVIQLVFLSVVILSFSYSLFTLIFPCVRLSICLYSSVIYLSFMSVLHPVFPSFLTRSRLIYVIPCIFFNLFIPFQFPLCQLSDLWLSPPLIPLLLISSAQRPVFCCCLKSSQNSLPNVKSRLSRVCVCVAACSCLCVRIP